jgi:prepilin-type N-terminal cleavage/methylation domain-containing protein
MQGFTLVELLTVFGIIAILVAISFGITRGVQNAQKRAKAKVELMAITQALEEFKAQYGDYPWHDSDDSDYPTPPNPEDPEETIEVTNVMLLYALTGRIKFDPQSDEEPVSKLADSLEDEAVENTPKFLDISKFYTLEDVSGNPVALLDPWGNPYIYWYKWENDEMQPNPPWDVFGYHLYSTGPNGDEANQAIKDKGFEDMEKGILNDDFRDVADAEGIIFAQ